MLAYLRSISSHVCYFFCISWIRSYPTDRSFSVKIDSSSSPSTTILKKVPQGSILVLLHQTSGMHYQIIYQQFQLFLLLNELSNKTASESTFKKSNTCGVSNTRLSHHLFLLAHPDSSACACKIKPAQCIALCDTAPTTAIAQTTWKYHAAQLKAFYLRAYD